MDMLSQFGLFSLQEGQVSIPGNGNSMGANYSQQPYGNAGLLQGSHAANLQAQAQFLEDALAVQQLQQQVQQLQVAQRQGSYPGLAPGAGGLLPREAYFMQPDSAASTAAYMQASAAASAAAASYANAAASAGLGAASASHPFGGYDPVSAALAAASIAPQLAALQAAGVYNSGMAAAAGAGPLINRRARHSLTSAMAHVAALGGSQNAAAPQPRPAARREKRGSLPTTLSGGLQKSEGPSTQVLSSPGASERKSSTVGEDKEGRKDKKPSETAAKSKRQSTKDRTQDAEFCDWYYESAAAEEVVVPRTTRRFTKVFVDGDTWVPKFEEEAAPPSEGRWENAAPGAAAEEADSKAGRAATPAAAASEA